jgi:hypothetical protein
MEICIAMVSDSIITHVSVRDKLCTLLTLKTGPGEMRRRAGEMKEAALCVLINIALGCGKQTGKPLFS